MALDFPSAGLIVGQLFAGPNNVQWQWDGALAGVPELAVVLTGSRTIGRVGFLGAVERAESDYAASAETGSEAAGSRDPYAFGESTLPSLVLHVLCVRGGSQIDPAVIMSDAVDVIDLRGLLAGDYLEDDAMGGPEGMTEFDKWVADVVVVPGDVSRKSGVPPFPLPKAGEVFSGADLPAQDPGCLLVAETHLQVIPVRQNPVEVWHA
jgi:hypothetical protein